MKASFTATPSDPEAGDSLFEETSDPIELSSTDLVSPSVNRIEIVG